MNRTSGPAWGVTTKIGAASTALCLESAIGFHWPQGVPTLARSSQEINGLIGSVIHTQRDPVSFVGAEQIMAVVDFVYALVSSLANK